MHYSKMSLPGLKFTKTAKQVSTAVANRINHLKERQKELMAEVADICKRRGLSQDEVLAAGSNVETITNFTKNYESSVPHRELSHAVLVELQKDLTRVSSLSQKAHARNETIKDLERIVNNLKDENGTSFTFSLDEIVTLGF